MATLTLDILAVMVGDTETAITGAVPTNKEYNISMIRFTNTDTIDHQLTVWNYTPGSFESADNTTAELFDMTLQPKQSFEFGPILIPADRVITAQADAGNFINARVHGWVVDV
jgi:hypothetical protein